ncbi:serine hydrolase [Propionibacteriaceae bacterium Y1700]|uniref:serine hydrolase n=1 Tax=Microlunatus sp. Y1700 TaxID=3418487 RepID=UPI003DA6D77A
MTDRATLATIWNEETAPLAARHVIIELDSDRLLDGDPSGQPVPTRFSGASMIKTFLALIATEEVAARQRSWDDEVTVTEDNFSAGDGVLNAWRLPATMSLANLQQLMIGLSDNTATNTMTDVLGGVAAVNARLAQNGFDSRLRRHCGQRETPIDEVPDPALPSPPGFSIVVPGEHLTAMRRAMELDELTRRHFESQEDRRSLARFLDEDVIFAHKTGTSEGARHDAGILVRNGQTLAVSMFSDSTVHPESADHPACVAAARGMARTLELLGWQDLLAGDFWPVD